MDKPRLTIPVVVSLLFAGVAAAQSVDDICARFTKRYHTFQSLTIPYHTFVPPDSIRTEGNRIPLVLCLHGAGERGDDGSAVKSNSMAIVWARDSNQTRWPSIVVVPQCPLNGWWTDTGMISALDNLLDSLIDEYPVDTTRVYITGLSMGGYGTWSMIQAYPRRFAAAIPMSGGGDPSKAGSIKDIPIWNFHGVLDNTVPVSNSRSMIAALEQAGDTIVYTDCRLDDCAGLPDSVLADVISNGAMHLYTEYQYGGHSIWDRAYNNPFLLPWTFSKSRPGTPVDVRREFSSAPDSDLLLQNYPNPFNPVTVIRYRLSAVSRVNLKVYDVLGREVRVLVNRREDAGSHEVTFDASGLPGGAYFCRLIAAPLSGMGEIHTDSRKLVVLK